jgi:hypothetical protein
MARRRSRAAPKANEIPEQDVRIGHCAPSVDSSAIRVKLLARLKQIAPNLHYEFTEVPFKPTLVRVYATSPNEHHSEEEWSWTLPIIAYGRWVLTVCEFLQTEIDRLTPT